MRGLRKRLLAATPDVPARVEARGLLLRVWVDRLGVWSAPTRMGN